MTQNQKRLLRFVVQQIPAGEWTHLGEDSLDDAMALEAEEFIDINETKTKYRLAVPKFPSSLRLED